MTSEQALKRYVELTIREKALILITGLVLLGLIASHFILEPLYISWRQATDSGKSTEQTIVETEQQISEIDLILSTEMNKSLKQEIKQLMLSQSAIEQQLLDRNLALVSKQDMIISLKSLLNESNGLKVMSFRSVAPEAILTETAADGAGAKAAPTPLLYKHAIIVDIEGKYFSILKFLQKVEHTSDKILWSTISYSVLEHPKAAAKIVVYTLSTDKEFIGVSG